MISTHGYVSAEPPLGAPDTGGQVVYVLELSKVLARLGYTVDIYTRLFEDQVINEKVAEGVNIIRIPCGGNNFIPKEYMIDSMDEWIENAFSFIKSNQKKYLFINSHYWDAGYAGQELSKRLSISHIHTPHSLGSWKKKKMERDYPESMDSFEEQYNFSVRIGTETNIFNSADNIVATTPIQKDIIAADYNLPRKKIEMIPPGYDDNKFYPMAEASKTMLKEKFNFKDNCILALSRLAHNKGLDLLVESFGLLVTNHFDAQLILAIGHDDRSEVEEEIFQNILKIVEIYNIKDKIHFIGFIPDEELADIYRASDLFVLSSRYEPFGMTAVEAMACGTPTLVTKHGGLCEVLEDGKHAIVTDPFKPEAMASDMAAVLKHQGIGLHLSEEGSRIAREQFSWAEIASRLLANVKSENL
ncbi:MAG: glycosyltransferase [Spirochaetales bacterium]|nr:glycosyltransferase [Spirochaetales bacterium]